MAGVQSKKPRIQYEIACVCSLIIEYEVILANLDSIHADTDQNRSDQRQITLGNIGKLNTVVVLVAQLGRASFNATLQQLRTEFPALRFALSVGLCGAVPGAVPNTAENTIQLGDVVVSTSITQYDHGKRLDKPWKTARDLQAWPSSYLAGILKTISSRTNVTQQLQDLLQATYATMHNTVSHPMIENFDQSLHPRVHYGRLASSNMVIKNEGHRDQVARDLQVIGFEMEAAGLLPSPDLPLLLIRGVSDFADQNKDKSWQLNAALAASAYATLFLQLVEKVDDIVKDEDLFSMLMNLAPSAPHPASNSSEISPHRSQGKFICWTLPQVEGETKNERMSVITEKQTPVSPYEELLVHGSVGELEKRFCMPTYSCEPVPFHDICPGSMYRGICKLFMVYEKCPHKLFMGTGWMIDKSTLVTAGHNVYDKDTGHALKVSVQLGYSPPFNSTNIETQVETRYACHAAIHAESYKHGRRECDLAVLQVDKEFKDVTVIPYGEAQPWGTANLRIVGYPGDKQGSYGEIMYESGGKITWNLPATGFKLLHKLDTSGGMCCPFDPLGDLAPHDVHTTKKWENKRIHAADILQIAGSSGSPVLKMDGSSFVAIGVHTWGSKEQPDFTNEAVLISKTHDIGGLGNVIPEFLRALSIHKDSPWRTHANSVWMKDLAYTAPLQCLREIRFPLSVEP